MKRIADPKSLLAAIVLVSVASGSCRAAQTATGEAQSDLVLFVGVDLVVDREDSEGRIEDYKKNTMLIGTPAGPVTVRSSDIRSFRTVREPKIASTQVSLSDVRDERCFSPATDPELLATRQHSAMLAYQDEAQEQAINAQRELLAADDATRNAPKAQRERALAAAQQNVDAAQSTARNASIDPIALGNNLMDRVGEAFDTLRVSFSLASASELHGAYVLLVAAVREPGPGQPSVRHVLRELPPITGNPRKVRLEISGLPPGFLLQDYEIHIYSAGRELASNLSRSRTTLSRADAHKFLALQRELKVRGGDAPAEVASVLLAGKNARAIPAGQVHRTAQVGIDAEGRVTSVALDTAGSAELDTPIEAAIRSTLFLPTLRAGQPVASTLTFSLSEFIH